MNQIYIQDLRKFPFFQVDNALIEVYGRHIGAYAIAVYSCLACHANRDMIAFPSYKLIGEETGTSRSTAMRAVKTLIDWNIIQLIEEERQRAGSKEYENNRYRLMPQSEWKAAPVLTETGGVTQEPRGVSQEPRVVSEGNGGGVTQEHEQEPVQQEPKNKNQQQQPVVVSEKLSSVERHSPEYQELTERLIRLRVLPDRAPYLIERFPDACRRAVAWWEANPEYHHARNSPGAAVAASIETPAKYPQIYETPSTPTTAPDAPKRATKAEKRAQYAAAYDAVWQSLASGLRESLEREGKDKFEYIETVNAHELAAAIRQMKP